jgi:hypothetical protein
MKKICSITMIAVFFLLFTNGIEAQTTQTQLNQVELLKQFLGSWKSEVGKDTTCFADFKPVGTVMEGNRNFVTNGKTFQSFKELIGYDKKTDKFIASQLWISSPDMHLYTLYFTAKNICEVILFQDISNPEKAALKWKYEFKSPDLAIATYIENNKVVSVDTYNRVKK